MAAARSGGRGFGARRGTWAATCPREQGVPSTTLVPAGSTAWSSTSSSRAHPRPCHHPRPPPSSCPQPRRHRYSRSSVPAMGDRVGPVAGVTRRGSGQAQAAPQGWPSPRRCARAVSGWAPHSFPCLVPAQLLPRPSVLPQLQPHPLSLTVAGSILPCSILGTVTRALSFTHPTDHVTLAHPPARLLYCCSWTCLVPLS